MTLQQFSREDRLPEAANKQHPWSANDAQGSEILEFFGALRRRQAILFACFILITGLATISVYMITPQYEAFSAILIDVRERPLGNIDAIVTGLPAGSETIQSEIAVIESRDFLERVAQNLKLYEIPEFNIGLREQTIWGEFVLTIRGFVESLIEAITGPKSKTPVTPEEEFERERALVITTLSENLEVQPRAQTWVIDVRARSESPVLAARLANTIAELYQVNQLEVKYEATKRSTSWLTDRLSDLRNDLEAAEMKMEQYRSSAGLLQGRENVTLSEQQIFDINAQLTAARIRRGEVQARLRQAEQLLRSPEGASAAGDVLGSPIVQNLLALQNELMRQISELSATVGENHPDLIKVRAAARDLRSELAVEIGKVVGSLRNELAVATSQERALEQNLIALESKVGELNSREAELRILQREAETSRLLYETFLTRFKETQQQEEIQQADARIISRADVPLWPAFPDKKMVIALAAICSLLVGVLIVALFEILERGLRSMEEVYRYIGLPCFALVPAISKFRLARASPEDYVMQNRTSAYAEALRSLHNGIMMSGPEAKPKLVVVTSARPNEGKTSIAISMGRLMAMSGRRVILLDFDQRKPEVDERLRSPHKAGIVEYLSGEVELVDVVQKEVASGLEFIVSGRHTHSFVELLRSERLNQLLEQLRGDYDLVLVDGPPVLALADIKLLSRLADRTVLIVRWRDTPRNVVRVALRQLVDAGVTVAGVAISRVDVRRNAQYGFGDSTLFTGAFRKYYGS